MREGRSVGALGACAVWMVSTAAFADSAEELPPESHFQQEAQTQPRCNETMQHAGWSFQFDNDALARPDGHDEDYTGGIGFNWRPREAGWFTRAATATLGAVDGVFGARAPTCASASASQIGVMILTPDRLKESEPQIDDRPYSNVAFVAHTRGWLASEDDFRQTTLRLGVVGSAIGEELQTGMHPNDPQGWHHQISDGGEPTFQYTRQRRSLLKTYRYSDGKSAEVSFSRDLSLGYITEATAGISIRWGRLETPWWGFQSDPSVYGSQPGVFVQRSREWYFWFSTRARLRAYNVLMQGQFRDSEVTYDADELHHVLAEVSWGYSRQITESTRLSYVMRFQTSEVEKGRGDRYLLWGGLTLSVDL